MRWTAEAPAKVNRELRVGRLRSDGFHEVFSRMVSIDLADRITVEPSETFELSCDDPAVPSGPENLVARAARLLADRLGLPPRGRVRLEKRTPAGGGLGGGSADAAVALRLFARLWGVEAAARGVLPELAGALGSDVPFFLTGGEAQVRGRGEIVETVPDGPPASLLLLVPPFSVSTAAVYRAYAGRGTLPERLDVEIRGTDRFLGPNDLTPAVLEVEPRMEAYLASAARVSADCAISGSGSTIVLRAEPGARDALLRRHPEARVYACSTLTRDAHQRRIDPNGGPP
ncbi:MAG TPA: 4-(cytidine 5'-diphospho)-2-C-methyl-D-erythritol kinase [Thermoanaerobaculia bacterium]|nr:4-(cytidine 5'-diphospho)-2-C-methyl-D-erythritol kinase [Thermoanaerobaculia bacterium]